VALYFLSKVWHLPDCLSSLTSTPPRSRQQQLFARRQRGHVRTRREIEAVLRSTERYNKLIAVITEPEEVKKILRHLVKVGRPPPGLDPNFV
jgi:hypothetical protein